MKQLLVLLVFFSTALASPVRAQEGETPVPQAAPAQQEPQKEQDWQDHINDVAGEWLAAAAKYPFYNMAKLVASEEAPKDESGNPIVLDADGQPVIGPQRKPATRSS